VTRSDETIDRQGVPVRVLQAILTTPGAGDLLALTQAAGFPVGPGGVNHFGFLFASDRDVETAIEVAVRGGGSLVRRGVRSEGRTHETFAYVRDPDGYAIEIATQAILRRTLRRS